MRLRGHHARVLAFTGLFEDWRATAVVAMGLGWRLAFVSRGNTATSCVAGGRLDMKSMMIGDWTRVVVRGRALSWALPLAAAVAAACSAAPEDEGERGATTANGDSQSATLPPED